MSKQPAAPEAGGEPPSRARATNTAPSRGAAAPQPQTRHRNASVQRERHAVAGAPRDGAPTRLPTFLINAVQWRSTDEGSSSHMPEQPPGNGGVDGTTGVKPRPRIPPKPSYMPISQSRLEQPHATLPRPPVEQPHATSSRPPVEQPPIEPVGRDLAVTGGSSPPQRQHPQTRRESKLHVPPEKPKSQPIAFCFTACCILFWLLVIAVGVAVLVVYLIYRPQPPRLRVTSATLNAGYIDENGRGRMALNSDLTVLAAISNPNTKIDIVLHYMQLDLYFRGRLMGTQAVWPAPLHEGPGGNVLRSVHLVVSEVTMTQEDVMVWNATANGRPVALQIFGRFYTQLNFGRWLPFRYWVFPRCTLVLDPPPGGALRRARC